MKQASSGLRMKVGYQIGCWPLLGSLCLWWNNRGWLGGTNWQPVPWQTLLSCLEECVCMCACVRVCTCVDSTCETPHKIPSWTWKNIFILKIIGTYGKWSQLNEATVQHVAGAICLSNTKLTLGKRFLNVMTRYTMTHPTWPSSTHSQLQHCAVRHKHTSIIVVYVVYLPAWQHFKPHSSSPRTQQWWNN